MIATVGRSLGQISVLLALFAVPSFICFFAFSLLIGGDALNGFAESNKYFVASHGTLTEVSQTTFNISWYLGAFTLSTFIPMVLLGAISQAMSR